MGTDRETEEILVIAARSYVNLRRPWTNPDQEASLTLLSLLVGKELSANLETSLSSKRRDGFSFSEFEFYLTAYQPLWVI